MKTFRQYLAEATRAQQAADDEPERPRPTKEREPDPFGDLGDIFGDQPDQPLANREPERDAPRNNPQDDNRRRASQADTLRATQNMHPTDRMRDMMSRMRDIEGDPDQEEYPTPDEPENLPDINVNTANLPSVAGQALRAAGVEDPDFHQVANLPGNMSRAIRTLGKALFGQFTSTPTNDIWMVGNLGGQGPNSRQEVNAVANWIRSHGEEVTQGDIDFDTTIPGYRADIKQYTANGIRWLLVQDEFGNYIYSWPESTSRQRANTQELGHERRRLPNR